MAYINLNDDESKEPDMSRIRSLFGPGQVDQTIRNAIQICWMMLPDEKKTPDDLEKAIREIVDRAIQDFREDANRFKPS